MKEVESLISLYHMGYLICLGAALFFLLLAVFFFFKFNIRNIFAVRTGRAMRKSIQQMEESNAMTGKLRHPEEMQQAPSQIRTHVSIQPGEQGETETEVLNEPLLEKLSGRLGRSEKKKKKYPIRFQIEKDLIIVHSDERI